MSEKTIKILKKDFSDPVDKEKFAGTYVIRAWRWGQKNVAISKSTKIDLTTMIPTVDTGLMNRETLAGCLKSAPFPTNYKEPNYEMIDDLPSWLGDVLNRTAIKLNREVDKDRRKNLSAPQGARKAVTPPGS